MIRQASVPFHLVRSQEQFTSGTVTSTQEATHGLLRLDGDRLVVQWRTSRRTEHMGAGSVRSDQEVEAVRELIVPLAGIAGAGVRRRWWLPRNPTLVLRAADLRAFEEVAGESGLKLDHPAELVLGLRRADVLVAEEFAAELALAVAERALGAPLGAPDTRPALGRPGGGA